MDEKKLVDFSKEMSMLNTLYEKGLITEPEFEEIKRSIEKTYIGKSEND